MDALSRRWRSGARGGDREPRAGPTARRSTIDRNEVTVPHARAAGERPRHRVSVPCKEQDQGCPRRPATPARRSRACGSRRRWPSYRGAACRGARSRAARTRTEWLAHRSRHCEVRPSGHTRRCRWSRCTSGPTARRGWPRRSPKRYRDADRSPAHRKRTQCNAASPGIPARVSSPISGYALHAAMATIVGSSRQEMHREPRSRGTHPRRDSSSGDVTATCFGGAHGTMCSVSQVLRVRSGRGDRS